MQLSTSLSFADAGLRELKGPDRPNILCVVFAVAELDATDEELSPCEIGGELRRAPVARIVNKRTLACLPEVVVHQHQLAFRG